MKEREKYMLRLDPEPEDDEPPTPYWEPDWENDNLFNKSEEIPEWVKECTFE